MGHRSPPPPTKKVSVCCQVRRYTYNILLILSLRERRSLNNAVASWKGCISSRFSAVLVSVVRITKHSFWSLKNLRPTYSTITPITGWLLDSDLRLIKSGWRFIVNLSPWQMRKQSYRSPLILKVLSYFILGYITYWFCGGPKLILFHLIIISF